MLLLCFKLTKTVYLFQMGTSRALFFTTALNILRTAAEISDCKLQQTANDLSAEIDKFIVPCAGMQTYDEEMLDDRAMKFLPTDAP